MPVKDKNSRSECIDKKNIQSWKTEATLIGGFSENQLQSYTAIADVTPNTNGLKTAEKQDDGSLHFQQEQQDPIPD